MVFRIYGKEEIWLIFALLLARVELKLFQLTLYKVRLRYALKSAKNKLNKIRSPQSNNQY